MSARAAETVWARGRPNRGFTLLEVLVALIIFALAFGMLAQIVQTGLRQSRSAADANTATLLARSVMARIGVEIPIEPREDEGEVEGGYRWRSLIRPIELEDAERQENQELLPFEVQVTVSWGEVPREQSLTLTSLRLAAAPQ